MTIGLSEILAAFVGAAATGLFGVFDRRSERARKKGSLEAEIAAHARFLTGLIRDQGYARDANLVAERAGKPDWDGSLVIILPKSDYLHGLLAVTNRAGELEPNVAGKLIEFHHRCNLFVDSTNPHERYLEECSLEERRSHAVETAENIKRLLLLGDDLGQLK